MLQYEECRVERVPFHVQNYVGFVCCTIQLRFYMVVHHTVRFSRTCCMLLVSVLPDFQIEHF